MVAAEVEAVLMQHAHVKQVAAIGQHEAVHGDKIVAFVVKSDDKKRLSTTHLMRLCQKKLQPYQVPKKIIFCDINCHRSDLKNILAKKNHGPICILVGPEGDFSEKERQSIIEKKEIFSLSLAKNILRAETAAIASVTIVNYHLNLN